PDRPFIYEKLTAGEFLRFHGGLYGMDAAEVEARATEMLDLFELGRWQGELVESFSHGMKQRLVMCAAFLHRPRAVLVDEPMVGLDPRGARLIKDIFRHMSQRGVAILMSTHTLEVAQEMCDNISIILRGQIIARGTVDELLALAGGEDEQLTPVFLKLTGGSGLQEIAEARPPPRARRRDPARDLRRAGGGGGRRHLRHRLLPDLAALRLRGAGRLP